MQPRLMAQEGETTQGHQSGHVILREDSRESAQQVEGKTSNRTHHTGECFEPSGAPDVYKLTWAQAGRNNNIKSNFFSLSFFSI